MMAFKLPLISKVLGALVVFNLIVFGTLLKTLYGHTHRDGELSV